MPVSVIGGGGSVAEGGRALQEAQVQAPGFPNADLWRLKRLRLIEAFLRTHYSTGEGFLVQ